MSIDEVARLFQALAWEHLGVESRITSTVRSTRQQQQLYRRASNLPAAAPGRSTHEYGLAFDIVASRRQQRLLGEFGEFLGLWWGGRFRRPDPVHFQVVDPAEWQFWLSDRKSVV